MTSKHHPTALTVIADPTGLFDVGDVYSAEDIHAWRVDGLLPEGLVLRNGRYFRVHGGQLKQCEPDGTLRRGPHGPLNGTRWRVFLALSRALEAGEPPTYRELAATVGVPLGSIGWALLKLEEAGLIVRGRYQQRSVRLTELGAAKVDELRAEEVTQ